MGNKVENRKLLSVDNHLGVICITENVGNRVDRNSFSDPNSLLDYLLENYKSVDVLKVGNVYKANVDGENYFYSCIKSDYFYYLLFVYDEKMNIMFKSSLPKNKVNDVYINDDSHSTCIADIIRKYKKERKEN